MDYNTEQANALRARAEMLHLRADQLAPRPADPAAVPECSSVVLGLPGNAWLAVHATNVSDGLFACFVRDAVAAVLSAGAPAPAEAGVAVHELSSVHGGNDESSAGASK